MKEAFKIAIIKVKAWLWALAANLWEDYLKDELKHEIDILVDRGVSLVHTYHDSADYQIKKDMVIEFIFKNIQLPKLLRPFKGLIKGILSNSIDFILLLWYNEKNLSWRIKNDIYS